MAYYYVMNITISGHQICSFCFKYFIFFQFYKYIVALVRKSSTSLFFRGWRKLGSILYNCKENILEQKKASLWYLAKNIILMWEEIHDCLSLWDGWIIWIIIKLYFKWTYFTKCKQWMVSRHIKIHIYSFNHNEVSPRICDQFLMVPVSLFPSNYTTLSWFSSNKWKNLCWQMFIPSLV